MPRVNDLNWNDPFSCLLVGKPGSGKSHCAKTFPGRKFVFDTGGEIRSYRGTDTDYEAFVPKDGDFPRLHSVLTQVLLGTYSPDDPANNAKRKPGEGVRYDTHILDNASGLFDLIAVTTVRERLVSEGVSENGSKPSNFVITIKDYKTISERMRFFLIRFRSLPGYRVACAHEDVITDENDWSKVVEKKVMLPGKLASLIPGHFDEVFYAKVETEMGRTVYRLQTSSDPLVKARSRLSGDEKLLPQFIQNEFKSIVSCIPKIQALTPVGTPTSKGTI